MSTDSSFKVKLSASKSADEEKKKAAINQGGPFAKLFIYLIKDIFLDYFVKTFYNMFIDILGQAFTFVDDMFFSDFKGVLAGKFKSKKGMCLEYTYLRYFITIMLPPMGVFLSRGLSAWFNIFICGLLSLVNYYPGFIYAIIVIQTAPYANRYQEMKRDKLKRERQKLGVNPEAGATPLFIFGLTALCIFVFMLISLGIDKDNTINGFNNIVLYLNSGSSQMTRQQQY